MERVPQARTATVSEEDMFGGDPVVTVTSQSPAMNNTSINTHQHNCNIVRVSLEPRLGEMNETSGQANELAHSQQLHHDPKNTYDLQQYESEVDMSVIAVLQITSVYCVSNIEIDQRSQNLLKYSEIENEKHFWTAVYFLDASGIL